MNRRLLQFIEAENLTQSQFADTLGVARASISHILSGRNKPGYDFIESLMIHFPSLNLEWLFTGQGKMYNYQQQAQPQTPAPPVQEDDLFSQLPEEPVATKEPAPSPAAAPVREPAPAVTNVPAPAPAEAAVAPQKHICKLIALYSDGTFAELS